MDNSEQESGSLPPDSSSGKPRLAGAVRWNIAALVLATITAAVVALMPSGSRGTDNADGSSVSSRTSLLESEGIGVLLILAVPILLVSMPLLFGSLRRARQARLVVLVLLALAVILAAASVGVFYLPTLGAMIAAAGSGPRNSSVANPPPPRAALPER